MPNEHESDENSSVFSYLTNLINQFTLLPTADGLIPLNPVRLPSYYLGSILTSDQRIERNDIL